MDNGASSYRRFLDGDETAFDDIIKEHHQKLVFFINRYVHDLHAAEDIAIDVFSDLIVNRRRYNFKVKLSTYLYMLGRSRALNYLKHKKVLTMVDISAAENMHEDMETVFESLMRDETRHAVNDAIEKLPKDMCAAVHLVYFENLTYKEAAQVLKKNQKQIDNLLYRAKCELRTILGKDGELSI